MRTFEYKRKIRFPQLRTKPSDNNPESILIDQFMRDLDDVVPARPSRKQWDAAVRVLNGCIGLWRTGKLLEHAEMEEFLYRRMKQVNPKFNPKYDKLFNLAWEIHKMPEIDHVDEKRGEWIYRNRSYVESLQKANALLKSPFDDLDLGSGEVGIYDAFDKWRKRQCPKKKKDGVSPTHK